MVNQAYWSWINGEFTTSPLISTTGGLAQHGYGAFETCLAESHKIRYWKAHIVRLKSACETLHLEFNIHDGLLREIALELLKLNDLPHARLKILVAAADLNYYSEDLIKTDIIISALPYTRNNTLAKLHPLSATQVNCSLSPCKTSNYLGYIQARRIALREGASDALLLSPEGDVIETSSANIFIRKGGQWFTPSLSKYGLPGIQRQHVLIALRELNFEINETFFGLEDWDEAFICNSLIGLQQVKQVGSAYLQIGSSNFSKIRTHVRALETLEV